MPRRKKRREPPALFRQPPADLYTRPTVYQCGDELEVDNYRRILDYAEDTVRVDLGGCVLTICGDGLRIAAIEPRRLRLSGRCLRLEYGYP